MRGVRGAAWRPGRGWRRAADVNAIALWNTTYIADILDTVSRSDAPPDPAAIARLSPLVHEHIRLVGPYRFELPSTVADGCRRPIAMPPDRSIV